MLQTLMGSKKRRKTAQNATYCEMIEKLVDFNTDFKRRKEKIEGKFCFLIRSNGIYLSYLKVHFKSDFILILTRFKSNRKN